VFAQLRIATGRDESDDVKPLHRILDQHHFLEGVGLAGEDRLHDLLERAIDVAHQRHAIDDAFADIEQGPAEDVGRQGTQRRQQDDGDQHAQARQGEITGQIALRIVACRDQRLDHIVHEADE
jgi:hypothetical protein